jgi:hypothetical protein
MIQWSLQYWDGAAWVSVPDVIRGSVEVETGFSGDPLIERVAATGKMTWRCLATSNHTTTTWIDRKVRLLLTYQNETFPMFVGSIRSSKVEQIEADWLEVQYMALDCLDDLARRSIGPVPYVGEKEIGWLIQSLVNPWTVQAPKKKLKYSRDLAKFSDPVLQEVADYVRSLPGFMFVSYSWDDPVIQVRDQSWLSAATPYAERRTSLWSSDWLSMETLDDLITEDGYELKLDQVKQAKFGESIGGTPIKFTTKRSEVFNDVQVSYYQRSITPNNVQVFDLQTPIPLNTYEPFRFWSEYKDPDGNACGAINVPLNPNDFNVEWEFWDSLTAPQIVNGGVNHWEVGVSGFSVGGETTEPFAYFGKLRIYARAIKRSQSQVSVQNSWSVNRYGLRQVSMTMPYSESDNRAKELANFIALQRGKDYLYVDTLSFDSLEDSSIMSLATLPPGSIIRVQATGQEEADSVLARKKFRILPAGVPECTFECYPILTLNRGIAYPINVSYEPSYFPIYFDYVPFVEQPHKGSMLVQIYHPLPVDVPPLIFTIFGRHMFSLVFYPSNNSCTASYVIWEGTQKIFIDANTGTGVLQNGWNNILVTADPPAIYINGTNRIVNQSSNTVITGEVPDTGFRKIQISHPRNNTYNFVAWFSNRILTPNDLYTGIEQTADLLFLGTLSSGYENNQNPAVELRAGLVSWEVI